MGWSTPKALKACWEALPPEKRIADQLDRRLARQAIQAGLLTLWQAQQLLAGRFTGYQIDRYVLLDMIGQGGWGASIGPRTRASIARWR